MAAVVQQLRTTDASKVPAGLEPGQVAFNLANSWMFVGNGTADILIDGAAPTAYSATRSVFGVAGIAIPAKPAAGKGYEIFELDPTIPTPHVYSITDDLVNAAAGVGLTPKANAALITATAITSAADLGQGDTLVITAGTGSPFAAAPLGSYVWDGAKWVPTGGSSPDATAHTAGSAGTGTGGVKGVVYLARATDVLETGAATATTPDPLAVATAAQLKALADRVGTLATGHALLGTYDGSTSGIKTVNPTASVGGRAGFAVAAKISAGTGMLAGDYFVVSDAGTIAGDTVNINQAVNVGDQILYDGAAWHVLAAGSAGGDTLHGLADVADSAVATVAGTDVKGLLVRDNTIADGLPGAYKLISVLDLGTF